jgi:hypothetical protein
MTMLTMLTMRLIARGVPLLIAVAMTSSSAPAAQPGLLERLEVAPAEVRLVGRLDRVQLVVTGVRPDGSLVDVTSEATIVPGRTGVVSVVRGAVVASGDGATELRVRVGERLVRVGVQVSRCADPPRVGFETGLLAALSKQGCSSGGCHGAPAGKGGFRMSLRGFDPRLDVETLIREQFGRRTNTVNPDQSLLLRKPLMRVAHGGGQQLKVTDPAYSLIREWIGQGCRPDSAGSARCVRTEVFPRDRVIEAPATSQQLRVVAHFDDGSSRDVTHLAVFTSSNEGLAKVDRSGRVSGGGTGQVGILVRYLDQMQAARVTLIEDRPGFAWPNPESSNEVDRLVHQRLKVLQVPPSASSNDSQFLRRVSLDVTGLLPTVSSTRDFLADSRPDKRNRLIERLLVSDEHALFWASKWADMFRVTRGKLGARGVDKFHRYLVASIRDNQPYDRFVTDLLTAQGDTFSQPAANYFRAATDTDDAAETTARHFLGIRIGCAKCHNHPYERWTQANYYGIAAFFNRIQRTKPDKSGNLVVWVKRSGELDDPNTGRPAVPWLPMTGPATITDNEADRRVALAKWLVQHDNPLFARVEVNRLWAWTWGRGIIEPVDDFRASNPPANPELLDWLEAEFHRSGFDRRHIVRLILLSRTYQRDSLATKENRIDTESFSHAMVRRMTAEQILDAICQVTGIPESYKNVPPGTRATQLPTPEGSPAFLRVFGKPKRETSCDCERQTGSNLTQFLLLANGSLVNDKVTHAKNRFRIQIEKGWTDEQIVEDVYLAAYSRRPTEEEKKTAREYINKLAKNRQEAHEDVQWAILNSKEFLFQH